MSDDTGSDISEEIIDWVDLLYTRAAHMFEAEEVQDQDEEEGEVIFVNCTLKQDVPDTTLKAGQVVKEIVFNTDELMWYFDEIEVPFYFEFKQPPQN